MGFDNECILNIQSLAGEYFCPVCRLLVYPNEALQSQCTHLYCKPCLTYVVGTTRACPYDGYLVTEADSKPLNESNKALAETIGKIAVHCLFHRSGCTWQGPLSDCTSHCSGCAFGNSPVVCNRCSIQIVHSQVQEHAQNCPGVQSQTQQSEVAHAAVPAIVAQATDHNQVVAQVGAMTSQPQISQATATTPALAPSQQANPNPNPNPQAQTVQTAVPTPEQLYQQQQQYQQYQQYPGYDPFQQQYQQYYPYQQQVVQQYQQQPAAQVYPQHQPQPQAQPQLQPAQPQPHLHVQASMPAPQQNHQMNLPHQLHQAVHPQSQIRPQSQQLAHGNPTPQSQSNLVQSHPPQVSQILQYQQPHSQMQQSLPQVHLQPQPQPQPQPQQLPLPHPIPQSQALSQPQHHPHSQPQPQLHPSQPNQPPRNMQHQSAHSVSGHQSYQQPQPQQHLQLIAPQQYDMGMHPQTGTNQLPPAPPQMQTHFPQQQVQIRPPHSHATIPNQQLPNPGQGTTAPSTQQQQQIHPPHQPGHPIHQRPLMQPNQQFPFPGQPTSSAPNHLHQHGGFDQQQLHMQSKLRPQASLPPQHSSAHPHLQSHPTDAFSHGTQSVQLHNHIGRPLFPNPGMQSLPFPQPLGGNPQSVTQSYPINISNQSRASEEQLGHMQHISHPPAGRDKLAEKNGPGHEIEPTSWKTTKSDANNVITSGIGDDSVEIKYAKHENDTHNTNIEDENVNGEAVEKKDQVIKHDEKLVGNVSEDQKDTAVVASLQVEQRLKVKESQVQAENLQEQSRNFHKDNNTIVQPYSRADQTANVVSSALTLGGDSSFNLKGNKLPQLPPPGQIQIRGSAGVIPEHGGHWPPPSNYGPAAPSMLHPVHPGPPQPVQGPGPHASRPRPQDPSYLGINGQPLNHGDYFQPTVRGPSHSGPPQRSFELGLGARHELYSQNRMAPSHAGGPINSYREPVGGPLPGVLPPPFESHGGMMVRAPKYGHEHSMGQHLNRGYLDGRQSELHHLDSLNRDPFVFNSGLPANMARLNRPPGHESLFRSSYIHDGGFYKSNMEAFDNPRKRKSISMGWCRICKVDCESLDLHAQTREHQDMAMDMVLYIKQQNAKKKMPASMDHPAAEGARKSKGAGFENRRNRY